MSPAWADRVRAALAQIPHGKNCDFIVGCTCDRDERVAQAVWRAIDTGISRAGLIGCPDAEQVGKHYAAALTALAPDAPRYPQDVMSHSTMWEDSGVVGFRCDGVEAGAIASENPPEACPICGKLLRLIWRVEIEEVGVGPDGNGP